MKPSTPLLLLLPSLCFSFFSLAHQEIVGIAKKQQEAIAAKTGESSRGKVTVSVSKRGIRLHIGSYKTRITLPSDGTWNLIFDTELESIELVPTDPDPELDFCLGLDPRDLPRSAKATLDLNEAGFTRCNVRGVSVDQFVPDEKLVIRGTTFDVVPDKNHVYEIEIMGNQITVRVIARTGELVAQHQAGSTNPDFPEFMFVPSGFFTAPGSF